MDEFIAYCTEEDLYLCPCDEWEIYDSFMPEIIEEADIQLLPDLKDLRRERAYRRKSFWVSKRRDHERFGKCGWLGGNPRYSAPRGWRPFDCRHADKLRLKEELDLVLQGESEQFNEDAADFSAYEDETFYGAYDYDDYEGEGSEEYDSSKDEDWTWLDEYNDQYWSDMDREYWEHNSLPTKEQTTK